MEELIENLMTYCTFVRENYFAVTIHTRIHFLDPYMYKLAPFNIHYNPYCVFLKSEPRLWDKCICNQDKIYQKGSRTLFYGMCHCGVCEYVLPFYHGNLQLGFISAGSFADTGEVYKTRIRDIAEKYCLSEKEITACYEQNLVKEVPDAALVNTLLSPMAAMLELLYIRSKELRNEEHDGENNYLHSRIVRHIRSNYMTPIRVEDIAHDCHFSPSYITKLFKKKEGKTIGEYLRDVRMEEAELLLKNTRLPVQELSALVGFADANYFTAVFTKRHGISPLAYRKQFLKQPECTEAETPG